MRVAKGAIPSSLDPNPMWGTATVAPSSQKKITPAPPQVATKLLATGFIYSERVVVALSTKHPATLRLPQSMAAHVCISSLVSSVQLPCPSMAPSKMVWCPEGYGSRRVSLRSCGREVPWSEQAGIARCGFQLHRQGPGASSILDVARSYLGLVLVVRSDRTALAVFCGFVRRASCRGTACDRCKPMRRVF
jgi:hypothetical protein